MAFAIQMGTMKNDLPEFDSFSDSYEDLLKDPIRDRFSAGGSTFFHARKRDLIRDYFRRKRVATRNLTYLDLGCGQGELMTLMRDDFAGVAGCDPSSGMLKTGRHDANGSETRLQKDPGQIPFPARQFDFVTAVCVYHHVPPAARESLTAEVARVLKPHGVFAIIEHNPYNPITQLIVRRAPVDADAILLRPAETRRLMLGQDFVVDDQRYFLYFPERIYRHAHPLEALLDRIPLGGQYAVFGKL